MLRFARRRLTSLRRAVGQTRWGRAVQRRRRARLRIPRALPPDPALLPEPEGRILAEALAWAQSRPPRTRSGRRPLGEPRDQSVRNVLFVSHCDFTGNSALHAYKLASELHARGVLPVLAVPDDPDTVEDVGRPVFPLVSYGDVRAGRLEFPDGRGPDLIHAFTPRERVRKLVTAAVSTFDCPYVVHLEDNDRAVLAAELGAPAESLEELPAPLLDSLVQDGQVHPLRGPHFVEQASGVSVVIDRLVELAPTGLPVAVVRPGVDEALRAPDRSRDEIRAELGVGPDEFTLVYTGTVHPANLDDMRNLAAALAPLQRAGQRVVLLKTGWNAPDAPEWQDGAAIRDLGRVPRSVLPEIVAAADALVQPGRPGPFNDYRFPAKLPDFLASGKPVILTRTNLGLELQDGREAIVLDTGTPEEFRRAISLLRDRPDLAREVGERGRAFALRELHWSSSTDNLESLYRKIDPSRPPPVWALELEPPVKLVALLPREPSLTEVRTARKAGIYGFSFPGESSLQDLPFYPRPQAEAVLERTDAPLYAESLRRLVLQALARNRAEEPLVFVDPRGALSDDAWLQATHLALRDGILQYYASRGLKLKARSVEDMLRLDSG